MAAEENRFAVQERILRNKTWPNEAHEAEGHMGC